MNHRVTTFLIFLFIVFGIACSPVAPGENIPGDPVQIEELKEKLTDPRLLSRLGVDKITIIKTETYRVLIGTPGTDQPIGEMYFTIQDGWHLKADHEVMEFMPGKGWVIAEQ